MAYALIANTGATGTQTGVTTGAIDTTGANVLIAHVSNFEGSGGSNDGVMSDSKGNTWTKLTEHGNATNASSVFYYVSGSPTVGSGHTFSFNGTAVFPSIAVQAWSGAHATPVDQQNGATATGTNVINTGSVTPSEDDELIVAGFSFEGTNGTVLIGSGFLITNTQNYSAGNAIGSSMAYRVETTATARNPQWNAGASVTTLAASIATFKAAAGGGGFLAAWARNSNTVIQPGIR